MIEMHWKLRSNELSGVRNECQRSGTTVIINNFYFAKEMRTVGLSCQLMLVSHEMICKSRRN